MSRTTLNLVLLLLLLVFTGCNGPEKKSENENAPEVTQQSADYALPRREAVEQVGPFHSEIETVLFRIEERYPGTTKASSPCNVVPIARLARRAEVEKKDGTKTGFELQEAPELLLEKPASLYVYLPFEEIAVQFGIPRSNLVATDSGLRIYLRPGLYGDIQPPSTLVQWSDGKADMLWSQPVLQHGQVFVETKDIGSLLSWYGGEHPLLEDSVYCFVEDTEIIEGTLESLEGVLITVSE